MIALLNTFLKMIPPLVLATAALMFLAFGLFQSWRLDSANKALGAAVVAVDRAVEVNVHNGEQLAGLEVINKECLDGRRADETQFRTVAAEWQVRRVELESLASLVRREEIEVYREPNCREFAQLDITAICPDLVVQWRNRIAAQ